MQAVETIQDFTVHKFRSYSGPNYYLNRQAFIFNLFLNPDGPTVDFYKDEVIKKFPQLEKHYPKEVITLFTTILTSVFKMNMDLFVGKKSINSDGEEWTIAMEHIDDYISMEIVYFVRDWFASINNNDHNFDFEGEYRKLQSIIQNSIFGAPTIYAMIEGAVKKNINVHYHSDENQFQWGYGRKQIRGNSTIFHTDSKIDIDFISYKDCIHDFLTKYGFPTPPSRNVFYADEIIEEATLLGYPVVVKPVKDKRREHLFRDITSPAQLTKAFHQIVTASERINRFDGAILQKQIPGFDYRILTVGGKYAACMQRTPPNITGDGQNTIEQLIALENQQEVRKDQIRSPLRKIIINQNLIKHLQEKGLSISDIPQKGKRIYLRNVSHISSGGVSTNVTGMVHKDNIILAESIAKFFNITVLGIDMISENIEESWKKGNLGVIDINAGPGIFMHLYPAVGKREDIPKIIMQHLFNNQEGADRIPIIAGNCISSKLITKISAKIREFKKDVEIGSVRKNGIYFNNNHITKKERHDTNCEILLRNPKLDIAIINHTRKNIETYGIWHQGLDLAILENAGYSEYILKRDLVHNGLLLEILDINDGNQELLLTCNEKELKKIILTDQTQKEEKIFNMLKPYLKKILHKYDA